MQGFRIGFNHNVHYRGRVYHVQSEDMGRRCAYAITHVFDDTGRVVKSRKLSYAGFEQDTQVLGQIHELLRRQHTRVVDEVTKGIFDEELSPSQKPSSVDPLSSQSCLTPVSGVRPVGTPHAAAPSAERLAAGRRTSQA